MSKIFTLNEWFDPGSPLTLAVEFERDDEELREYARINPNTLLEFGPYSGFFSLQIRGEEFADPAVLTYPMQHLGWLNARKLLEPDPSEISKLEADVILGSNDPLIAEYRRTHQHLFSFPDEELPILYRREADDLRVESRAHGRQQSAVISTVQFSDCVQRASELLFSRMRETFPPIEPRFRFEY
jgi:hypothetical protein